MWWRNRECFQRYFVAGCHVALDNPQTLVHNYCSGRLCVLDTGTELVWQVYNHARCAARKWRLWQPMCTHKNLQTSRNVEKIDSWKKPWRHDGLGEKVTTSTVGLRWWTMSPEGQCSLLIGQQSSPSTPPSLPGLLTSGIASKNG